MKPLLSIVVPTKDRYKYLKHLILLIDSFNSNEIELILQDNTVNNEDILDFIGQNNYPFIKYFHNKEQLPICDNSDLAILHSSGEYVCFIGDDDGVTSHIIDCVRWMKNEDVDVVVPSTVSYRWPDFINSITGNLSATLSFKEFKKTITMVNPMTALRESMKKGFINRGNLPLLYHGIVKREVLDKIYDIGKTFFPGPSPDIANGVALCPFVKKYARVDFPIIISGASVAHGGGVRKLKNKVADIDDVPALPKKAKENWEQNIPRVWAGVTVWPESAIKALRYLGREDLIKEVNFEHMLASFIVFHSPLCNMAMKLSENKFKLFLNVVTKVCQRYFNGIRRLIMRKLFQKSDGKKIIYNLNDIEQAHLYLYGIEPDFDSVLKNQK